MPDTIGRSGCWHVVTDARPEILGLAEALLADLETADIHDVRQGGAAWLDAILSPGGPKL